MPHDDVVRRAHRRQALVRTVLDVLERHVDDDVAREIVMDLADVIEQDDQRDHDVIRRLERLCENAPFVPEGEIAPTVLDIFASRSRERAR
jgi:hypothetical protein